MNLEEMNKLSNPENAKKAKKLADNRKQELIDLAQAYHKVFKTDFGAKVLQDLTNKMIYNNDVQFNSPNINYESAYHNGEAGAIKYIINQITKAESL